MSEQVHGTARAYADNLTIRERVILDLTCAAIQHSGMPLSEQDKRIILETADQVLDMMERPA